MQKDLKKQAYFLVSVIAVVLSVCVPAIMMLFGPLVALTTTLVIVSMVSFFSTITSGIKMAFFSHEDWLTGEIEKSWFMKFVDVTCVVMIWPMVLDLPVPAWIQMSIASMVTLAIIMDLLCGKKLELHQSYELSKDANRFDK